MNALIEWLSRHPWKVIMLSGLLSLAALLLCFDLRTLQPRLQIDPSVERLLPANGSDRAVYAKVRETFGDAEAVIVAVKFDRIFSAQGLEQIEQMTQKFKKLQGVRSVFSLATAPNLVAMGDDLEVSSFTVQARRNPELIADFPRQFNANPLYKGTLISQDGSTTAFALLLKDVNDDQFIERDYTAQIRRIVQEVTGGAPVWIAGSPVASAATTKALVRTIQFTIPAVFAVILLLLLVAFRSLSAVLMAAVAVGMALLWTMAAAVLLKVPMNLVTAIVPPLVITLGLSYAIYLFSAYFSALREESLKTPEQRVRWTIERASVGLVLSAGTTVASFCALLINILPSIKHFAILASIGSAFGVLLSLTFLPAALSLCGSTSRNTVGESWFARWGERLAVFDQKWRTWIITIALIMIPLDLIFAARIQTGSDFIQSFKEGATVRRDFEAINTAFNGANAISILVETYVDDALTDPERIRVIESLQTWLRQQPEVGAAVSFVDHLKLINQSLNGNDPAYHRVPADAAAVKQLLVFGAGEDIKNVIDTRFRTALISLRINVDGSVPVAHLVERIEERLKALPPPLDAKVTGSPVLATRTVQQIASGHFISTFIATAAIWLLLSLMFTSMRAGFIALLPTVVPVAVYFGTLGLFDISLSPTTCLIACIVIGIAVDDTIQFLARFNADARAAGSEKEAVKTALSTVLRPVTLSTVALCLGFLVFTGSELRTQVQFGLLSAFTLALAWFMNITLTPALGSRLRIVTLWDLVRLDLGQSPQHTIPLFSGLSSRQARVFALLSKLESVSRGALVIKEGDIARDMFVIVDGSFEIWVERGGEHKVLSTLGRGAVVGEAGYFGQRRTANVQAATPARVLRFDSQDLERLRVRFPRIAATIFRNLNRVQAERIARMTAMLH